jgi:hypothetical protein
MKAKSDGIQKSRATADESNAIALANVRLAARPARLSVTVQRGRGGQSEKINCPHSDPVGWGAHLQDVFATKGFAFATSQLNRLIQASRDKEGKIDSTKLNSMLTLIEGAAPQSEVQAALAVQMALTHSVSQTLLERSLRVDQIPQFDSAANAAVKMLRTFALQAETLAKLQRGGEQVVKVIHVHAGAQAIVGNVTHSVPGGGDTHEISNQPHASVKAEQVRHSSTECGAPMLRENTERETLPVPSRQR